MEIGLLMESTTRLQMIEELWLEILIIRTRHLEMQILNLQNRLDLSII
nr:MAG TPA: hypothetical protein [Caudoviricetes sp.]